MIKKLLIISISLILFGCGSNNGKQKSKEILGKNIKISEIKPESIIRLNISSGVTEPLNEVKVVTKTGGTVKRSNYISFRGSRSAISLFKSSSNIYL